MLGRRIIRKAIDTGMLIFFFFFLFNLKDETVTFYEGGPKEEWKSEAWGRYSSSSHDGFEGSRAHGLP